MLPVELQRIILGYAGIYYAQDLEQLRFVNKFIYTHIDAIIINDDVEALKLYHRYYRIHHSYRSSTHWRMSMCSRYNSYQCCEFIFKTHQYIDEIRDVMRRCIMRNLTGPDNGYGLNSGNTILVRKAISYRLFEDSFKPGRYANFEEMLKMFRRYYGSIFKKICYEFDRGDLIDEVMPSDFGIFGDYDWFFFLYKHPSVQNNPQYKQEIGHYALYGCKEVVWHLVWDGYQPTKKVFERYVNTPDREFNYSRTAIISILKQRLQLID